MKKIYVIVLEVFYSDLDYVTRVEEVEADSSAQARVKAGQIVAESYEMRKYEGLSVAGTFGPYYSARGD
jgi:hypothetical protein